MIKRRFEMGIVFYHPTPSEKKFTKKLQECLEREEWFKQVTQGSMVPMVPPLQISAFHEKKSYYYWLVALLVILTIVMLVGCMIEFYQRKLSKSAPQCKQRSTLKACHSVEVSLWLISKIHCWKCIELIYLLVCCIFNKWCLFGWSKLKHFQNVTESVENQICPQFVGFTVSNFGLNFGKHLMKKNIMQILGPLVIYINANAKIKKFESILHELQSSINNTKL